MTEDVAGRAQPERPGGVGGAAVRLGVALKAKRNELEPLLFLIADAMVLFALVRQVMDRRAEVVQAQRLP